MNKINTGIFIFIFFGISCTVKPIKQEADKFRIVGYYSSATVPIDSFEIEKLTHLIFCFGRLEGNRLHINSATDSATIKRMVQLKSRNPEMKVMLSLGGWGGCETCSNVFSTKEGIEDFAQSVKEITGYFKTDGIDLDWEYPAIKGFPGHSFKTEDRNNFTTLLKELRKVNGDSFEISFAAGGFTEYINTSINWKEAMQYTNFVNIMSYDLVHGYSTTSGHHTPLYSTPQQIESTDHAVKLLLDEGVPAGKLVIGAAFYGRFFKIDEGSEVELYQPCKFSHAFSSKNSIDSLSASNGFELRWDSTARAPYAINVQRKLLATYDDERSVALKTKYAVENKLGGVMFWQLVDDKFKDGLLGVVYENR